MMSPSELLYLAFVFGLLPQRGREVHTHTARAIDIETIKERASVIVLYV